MTELATTVEQYPDAGRYVDFNITPEFDADPTRMLVELSKQAPVVAGRNGLFDGVAIPNNFLLPDEDQDMFIALSWDAVQQLATDGTSFSAELAFAKTLDFTIGKSMVTMDDPEHMRYKRLVLPSFGHKMVNEELQNLARPIIDECLDAIAWKGKGELLAEFTSVFPYRVVAAILGVPDSIREDFCAANDYVFRMAEDPVGARAALGRLDEMCQQVIDEHRAKDMDDMITALLNTESEGDFLSDEEVRMFIKLILGAGLDTTTRQTATLIYLLLKHPDQFALLQEQPELIEQAVWESLRICGASTGFPRIAIRETEICGVKIPKGSGVIGSLRVPNHDETRWEDPFRFDITRPKQQIISFNFGVHTCLGKSLALAEMRIAMEGILDRLPNLRKDEARWQKVKMRGWNFRSPTQLPVKWDVTA